MENDKLNAYDSYIEFNGTTVSYKYVTLREFLERLEQLKNCSNEVLDLPVVFEDRVYGNIVPINVDDICQINVCDKINEYDDIENPNKYKLAFYIGAQLPPDHSTLDQQFKTYVVGNAFFN